MRRSSEKNTECCRSVRAETSPRHVLRSRSIRLIPPKHDDRKVRASVPYYAAWAFALAKQHQVEAMPDMLLLASYALATGDSGLQAPRASARLE